MRKIWVRIDPWDKELATTAIEGGAEAVLVPNGYSETVKALGRIRTVAEDGDLVPERDLVFFPVRSASDEAEILRLSREKAVVLECADWSIIPMENLIAQGAKVIARVSSLEEARTAFGILEKGVDRILFDTRDAKGLKKALSLLAAQAERIALTRAEIRDLLPVGMGDRVCVDTCTAMGAGQGMLVGNSGRALFLVHAESVENPYVAPRPFRVNAGAVHAYIRVPGGKTRYLSELAAGDPVLIVDARGETAEAVVGRVKIEKRPMLLVRAAIGEETVSTLVQNAETIRLVTPEGLPASVVNLKAGDPVLLSLDKAGRHFGHAVEESISEK